MLQSFNHSLPFLITRIVLVLVEGATLYFGSILFHSWFVIFMSGYVDGLFLKVVSLMGWIIGVGLSTVIVKYPLGVVQYYLKLAHIIYLTTLILEYRPYTGSRLNHALSQAIKNFTTLALNDLTTKSIVKALTALKNAILNIDLLSRFKEPETSIAKFVKAICGTALSNVINMTDEIIVSYTWFTNDLYEANRLRQGDDPPNKRDKVKNQAVFMLEGMVFTVRILPQLMMNSLLFEVAFLLLANIVTITGIVVFIGYLGFSFIHILWAIILYRTLLHITYYVIIESLRLNVYLYSFYAEVNELSPFNITEMIGNLLGKVPMLAALVRASGQNIEPTGTEGSPIMEGDLGALFRDNVTQVASSFNLNTDELIDNSRNDEELDISVRSNANTEEPIEQSVSEEPVNIPVEPDTIIENNIIDSDEIEVEMVMPNDPFASTERVTNIRG